MVSHQLDILEPKPEVEVLADANPAEEVQEVPADVEVIEIQEVPAEVQAPAVPEVQTAEIEVDPCPKTVWSI